jgi:hypothetical protein
MSSSFLRDETVAGLDTENDAPGVRMLSPVHTP